MFKVEVLSSKLENKKHTKNSGFQMKFLIKKEVRRKTNHETEEWRIREVIAAKMNQA